MVQYSTISASKGAMDVNLSQYLANVFRNEVGAKPATESQDRAKDNLKSGIDRNLNPFVVDKKYSLRLDEII